MEERLGHSMNLELVTIPCFLPFTKRVSLRNLIERAFVPEEIRSLLCLSRIDSTFLACGDISGLIDILGRLDNCLLLARTELTSFALFIVVRTGRWRSSEYFPSL